jgi:hypothetical protein
MDSFYLPEWTPPANMLVEPEIERRNLGWGAGESPPAGVFNWFWNKTYNALKVIRDHDHDARYYTRMEMGNIISNMAPKEHEHEGSDIISKVSEAANADEATNSQTLQGRPPEQFADNVHYHDDRYYTEDEIDQKLGFKSNTGHTHNYAPAEHIHDDIYKTESEIINLAKAVSVEDISIIQGTIEDGEKLPLPNGYTESQCSWVVSPRQVATTGRTDGYDDGKGIRFYADNDRNVIARFDGLGEVSGTANFIVIGVKK